MRNKVFTVGESVVLKILKRGDNARYMKDKTYINDWIKTDYAVQKVGRKYITVSNNINNPRCNVKFDKETLEEVSDYSADYELFHNKDEIYEDEKRKELFYTIELEFTGYGYDRYRKFTLSQLERINDILNENKGED